MITDIHLNNYILAIIAITPIIFTFFGILAFSLPIHKVSMAVLVLSAFIALIFWKMPFNLLLQAISEGIFIGLWPIIWVVISAIYAYNLLVLSGAMDTIKKMLSRITEDRRLQVLIIAFAFGGFLESTAGFGTSVAIPASILAALGFEPVFASVLCLVANTVPVALGVIGIPIITLSKVTNLPLHELTINTALQLLPLALILPVILVALTTGSIKKIKDVLPVSIVGGIAFGAGQTLVAWFIGPELSAVTGSLLSLVSILLWLKLFPVKNPWYFPNNKEHQYTDTSKISFSEAVKACSQYILIFILVLCTSLIPSLGFLNKFPFVVTHLFYNGQGGRPQSFSLLTSPGTIILISSIISAFLQRVRITDIIKTSYKTLKQIYKTIITVLSLVSMAKVMGYSGMISIVASSLASLAGNAYPLISPLIGALGTFITGSDTSSNVLFGELQKQTAVQIGANASWIAAANASGATIGKMISPQSISIATSATGINGNESKILMKTIKYAAILIVILGIIIFAALK